MSNNIREYVHSGGCTLESCMGVSNSREHSYIYDDEDDDDEDDDDDDEQHPYAQ